MKFNLSDITEINSLEEKVLLKIYNDQLYSLYADKAYAIENKSCHWLGFVKSAYDFPDISDNITFNDEVYFPVFYCYNDDNDSNYLFVIGLLNYHYLCFNNIEHLNAVIEELKSTGCFDSFPIFYKFEKE